MSAGGAPMSRRRLLTLAGLGGLAVAGGGAWSLLPAYPGTLLPSQVPLPEPFRRPLPVPATLTAGRPPDGTDGDFYEVTQRVATQEILPGLATPVWGYDGTFPGPTIVARTGRRVVLRVTNRLPEPTVTHLHGGHTPAGSDGFPTDLLVPAGAQHVHQMADDPEAVVATGSRDYVYPMRQRAATLWYHDHRMSATADAVWRGLAGMFIVRDDEESALPLPRGEREIPLFITDRSFAADGSFRRPPPDGTFAGGVLGDVILVNGAPWPVLDVAAVRYRFRILNASNSRRYRLALDPPNPDGLVQIGSDGGLLAAPVRHDAIELAPAERFDVVVDFSGYRPGSAVTLVNAFGSGRAAEVMRFRVTSAGPDATAVPDRLSTVERLDPAAAVATRDFLFQRRGDRWNINGRPFDPLRPIATPRLGDLEVWRFVTDLHHPIHLHLAPFQVLSRQAEGPGPYDHGWKDTVDLRPVEAVSVAVRFDDYPGRYVLHCHNLEHEDGAMMATIRVW